MLFATLLTGVCFVSCSDDDDNDNGGPSSIDNPLQNEAKVQISSITSKYSSQWGGGEESTQFFEYDSKSRPTASYQIYDDPDEGPEKEYEFKIDYNKGIVSWDGDELRVTFTNKGYIASLKGEYDEKDDGERYIGKSEMNLSYDKDGHLIKQTSLWKHEYISSTYPDGNYKETDTNELEFTWVNGNLISRTSKGVLIYERNGETSTEPYTYTSYFTYGNQPNKYKQYIAILEDDFGIAASGGLFGVFSQNLPVTYKETYKEEGYEDTYEYNGEFTLNDDGSIKTAAWVENGGSRYYYTYNYQPIGQRSTMVPAFAKSVVPSKATSVKEKINKMRRLGRFPFMSKKGFGQANAQD